MIKQLKTGKGTAEIHFPDKNLIAELKQSAVEYELTGTDEVKRSLASPIGAARSSAFSPARSFRR